MHPMEHTDAHEDVDMISHVLRKIADEMDMMDADHLMPENRKPKVVEAKIETHPMDQIPDESEQDSHDMLPDLMNKADTVDEEGNLPEDNQPQIDPEIAHIIAAKKKEQLPK